MKMVLYKEIQLLDVTHIFENNVHEIISSISAQSMLILGLNKLDLRYSRNTK